MALRSGLAKREQIPHEPGEWMDLRALGFADLDAARRARQGESFENIRQMGKSVWQMMQEVRAEMGANADSGPDDPLAQYDLKTLLTLGIVGWSYDAPVTPENIGMLDPATAQWAARVIAGAHETETDRKNGSEPSTSR